MLRHPVGRPRSAAASLLLLTLLGVLALALSQCRQVGDSLTGVRLTRGNNNAQCIAECSRAYNDSIRVESSLHNQNVHARGGNAQCLAQEEARHQAAVERIQAGRRACYDDCHHQGGGSGN